MLVESSRRLLALLQVNNHTVSFCESLTAGLASATFADSPGASRALKGGLITYATELKHSLAGVPQSIIDNDGVISEACAQAMAAGAQRVCASDWAVSFTGVAGPATQDDHVVGEVWIGIAGPEGTLKAFLAFGEVERIRLAHQGRTAIREAAVERGFLALINALSLGDSTSKVNREQIYGNES